MPEYALAPARANSVPMSHAAKICPGFKSCAIYPVLMNTPAPIMLATTIPTPEHIPSRRSFIPDPTSFALT